MKKQVQTFLRPCKSSEHSINKRPVKIKISWSAGIVIAMVSFMVFILSFVYKSIAMDEYQHELVSEDYYKDELHYQERSIN